jgi:hypothetical protein
MTIEELNKIIQEELKAYLNEEQTDEAYMEDGDEDAPEADGDDDIEVTTDEPAEEEGSALDTLRQIYDMLKPMVEPEEEEEPEMDMDDDGEEEEEEEMDEAVGYPNYKADQISKVTADATDVNKGLNESVERFKKLANIKG